MPQNIPPSKQQAEKVVFCDFDGTITAVETFADMLKEFTPELAKEIMPQLYAKTLTLRVGVRQMLESIPAKLYPEIMAYSDDKPIRPGLKELMDYLQSQQIPFVVISGGLKDMVERVLNREGLREKVTSISAVEIDTSGAYLKVSSQFEADTELVAKVLVMAKYPATEKIAIGDSITDVNMAMKADLVFARDRLQEDLTTANKPYLPWENFFDILENLQQRWEN
ncbi:MAG: HAD-IB family phosphatase [Gomphosphaeria aponina SAG 52.96 = DSM 107014]|uniref:HAD-IB family phosphatase n=1 Tax=Gomphosphaeria aponina SAG 52.96 = DSM 107014 TaxID=1521640 RepID=A0A941GW44_9CHRO|nr:HAD-IB family phosphatase [Gomphosphaeria aponina SAG 52.96 = DSM 107014]